MKKNKGFTLIELLVVIAIIGVLAAVILAALNNARGKGDNAAIQSNLKNAIGAAELYSHYNTPALSYSGVCVSTNTRSIAPMITAAAKASQGSAATFAANGAVAGAWNTSICNSTANGWAAQVPLKESSSTTGVWWCVDNTGFSKKTSNALGASPDVTCN